MLRIVAMTSFITVRMLVMLFNLERNGCACVCAINFSPKSVLAQDQAE